MLVNGPFGSDDKALNALEQSEMVSVLHRDGKSHPHFWFEVYSLSTCSGKPASLRPGKPVYRSAFTRLTNDRVFAAQQELLINAQAASSAESAIKSASEELINLTKLFSDQAKFVFTGSSTVPLEVAARVDALLKKMQTNEEAAIKLGQQATEYKNVLKVRHSEEA